MLPQGILRSPDAPPSTPGSSVECVIPVSEPEKQPVVRRCSSSSVEVAQPGGQQRTMRSQTSGEVVPQQQAPTPPPPVVYRRHPKMGSHPSLVATTLPGGKKATIAPMASGVLFVTGASKQADEKQVAPRYCPKHSTTENRPKTNLRRATCHGCNVVLETTYAEFTYCASCTNLREKCMLCGCCAPEVGTYVPPAKGTIMPPKQLGGRLTPYTVRERR